MAGSNQEVGRYVLPIIPSIEGIGPQIDRTLGKAFGGLSKQASQALAGGVRDGVAEAEAAVKKSTESISKLRDKEAAAADKVATAEARIEEVREKGGSALKRAEAQRNAAHRAQLAALREIERETESLTSAQSRLAEEQANAGRTGGARFLAGLRGGMSGAAEAGSGAASSFAEGFAGSSALLRLGSSGGPVGLALAAAGLIGGGLLVKNVMAGIEREPARDLVQAQLGLDEASMAQLSSVAAKAYADNFGETVQSNLSTAKTALQAGLLPSADDPGAQHVIEQLTAVSQILGEEIPATARAAGQIIKTGLADNVDQAFDLIVKGQQSGLNASEDLLDTFTEYGTQFRKLGLSGPESIGLLSQALKGGARDSDKAADAIKEFSIRAVDGSKTTMQAYRDLGFSAKSMSEEFAKGGPAAHEAFGQILAAVRSIDDPLKRGQVAASLFGTQWEDLGGAFDKFDLSTAVDELGRVDGAAQDASNTMNNNVANSFEEARRSIEISADAVQDKLAEAFGPELKKVADWVKDHTDDIAQFFTTMGEFAVAGVAQIVKFVADSSRALAQFVNVVGDVQGGIMKAGAEILDLVGQDDAAEQWRKDADSMFGLADGLYDFADAADRRYSDIEKLKDGIGDTGDSADDAKDSTKDLGDEIKRLPDRKDVKLNVTDAAGNPVDIVSGMPLFPTLAAGSNPFDINQGAPSPGGPPPGFPGAPPLPPGGGPSLNLPGITGAGGIAGGRPAPGSGFVGAPSSFPAAVEQWRPAVRAALGQFGPRYGIGDFSAWENALLQQIKTESSGNQGADNPSDSNAQGGTQHVRGLLQFLDSTYLANNITGRPVGDPLGQIAAAIPYVANKYGMNPDGSPKQIGRGQGFADGGLALGGVPGKDSIHALLMPKEFVSTVDATERNLPWLEAMNDGLTLPRFENGGLVPELEQVKKIAQGFGLQVTSGQRDGDSGYHGRGLAMDLSNGSANTPQMLAFAQYMASNFGGQLAELIYDSPGWSGNVKDGRNVGPFGDFYTMAQAGNHQNHVHVAVRGGSQSLSLGNQQLAGPQQVASAFGAGFQPGSGTPGYNELGEPGYYEVDPRQVAQAQRRAEDTQQAIADADQRILEAKQKRADLEDEINVTAEDRAKADREIADAQRAAQRAREDATWAQQDAEEARQGKFTAAKKSKQQNGKGGDLSDIGGIFGSFLKETLGIDGSLFPDLADLAPVKFAGNLLSAFKGPLLGAAQGQLGIQQPGWTPDQPVQFASGASGGGGLPFGLVPSPFDFAGTAAPGMAPPGTPASGVGSGPAPGPVDQSRNVSISVAAGPTPAEIGQTVRREVASVDRLNTYAPRGFGG